MSVHQHDPGGRLSRRGSPEGNYYMERLVETAAAEMGIDRVELRRRNHIHPGQMPYKAPSGMTYDSGELPSIMEEALIAADWDAYGARQAATRAHGRILGRGIGHYLEVTADAGNEMGGIRFEDDGNLRIITGTLGLIHPGLIGCLPDFDINPGADGPSGGIKGGVTMPLAPDL
jgi:carbon-monoxide dehydrogenase large subunit